MSKSAQLGLTLIFSSVFGAIWYLLGSYITKWTHYQTWILLGFASLAIIGLGLFWSELRVYKASRQLNRAVAFTTVGMTMFATGLAWLDPKLGVLLFVMLASGVVLFVSGITMVWNASIAKE